MKISVFIVFGILFCLPGCRSAKRRLPEVHTANVFVGHVRKLDIEAARAMLLLSVGDMRKTEEMLKSDIEQMAFLFNSFDIPAVSELKIDTISPLKGDRFCIVKYPLDLNHNRRVADSLGLLSLEIGFRMIRGKYADHILDYDIDGQYKMTMLAP